MFFSVLNLNFEFVRACLRRQGSACTINLYLFSSSNLKVSNNKVTHCINLPYELGGGGGGREFLEPSTNGPFDILGLVNEGGGGGGRFDFCCGPLFGGGGALIPGPLLVNLFGGGGGASFLIDVGVGGFPTGGGRGA